MPGLFCRKAVTLIPHVPARDAQVSPDCAVTVRVQAVVTAKDRVASSERAAMASKRRSEAMLVEA